MFCTNSIPACLRHEGTRHLPRLSLELDSLSLSLSLFLLLFLSLTLTISLAHACALSLTHTHTHTYTHTHTLTILHKHTHTQIHTHTHTGVYMRICIAGFGAYSSSSHRPDATKCRWVLKDSWGIVRTSLLHNITPSTDPEGLPYSLKHQFRAGLLLCWCMVIYGLCLTIAQNAAFGNVWGLPSRCEAVYEGTLWGIPANCPKCCIW